jgi:hypothetical protein
MNRTLRSQIWTLTTLACAIAGALATAVASAAVDNSAIAEARAQFEQDRAFCRSPESSQRQANCMKEAAAAYDEALWKARGRAESPRAALEPNARKIASDTTFMSPSLGSGTTATASGTDSLPARSDRR